MLPAEPSSTLNSFENFDAYARLCRVQKFLDVLDTPQFQRLRDIKQLGVAYRVFPGANHCRFSHSLGTCYLAQVALDHLSNQQPELEIEKYEREAVRLAGLIHYTLSNSKFMSTNGELRFILSCV